MDFRASEEEIMEQVLKDTDNFKSSLKLTWETMAYTRPSDFFNSLKNFRMDYFQCGYFLGRFVDDCETISAVECASTKCDVSLLFAVFLERALLVGGTSYYGIYGWAGNYRMSALFKDGNLTLEIENVNNIAPIFTIKGKYTRVLARLYGEAFATKFAQTSPVKKSGYQLHLTTHYIPELYRILSENEKLTSCMSKPSSSYDLPDNYHPTMCYEDSPNAALALVYDVSKGRHVGRAIVMIEEDGEVFYTRCYGSPAAVSVIEIFGIESSCNLVGLALKKIDTGDGYLLPYVDGCQNVDEEEDYFVVSTYGEDACDIDTGRVQQEQRYCDCCGDTYGAGTNFYSTADDGDVCEHCYHRDYVEINCDMYNRNDDSIVYIRSRDEYAFDVDCFYCDYEDEYYPDDEGYYYVRTERGSCFVVASCNIDEAISMWTVVEIDDEPLIDWLIENRDYEPEVQEEEAA